MFYVRAVVASTAFKVSKFFPHPLNLQDFSRIAALVAGHPALQAVQIHDAAHRQEEPG